MAASHSDLTLEQKVGQLFFIGIPGPTIDPETRLLLEEVQPGGVCLFARNIREARQTRDLLDELRATLPLEPLLSVDQEGGLVDRLRRVVTPMPAAAKMRGEADAERLGKLVGETLGLLGFNMNFAPVVDVIDHARVESGNGMYSREFGRSKDDVAALAGTFLNAMESEGILGCLKHFPGLGAAKVDSHEELPTIDLDEKELSAVDIHPYRELIGQASAVMVAHAAYPKHSLQEADQNGKLLPSSLSKNFITSLLRGRLGFGGVLITDDLEMGAILKNYGIGEASKMALGAGVDMLAICADPNNVRDAYRAVLGAAKNDEIAVNSIEGSLSRIAAVRDALIAPPAFDADRLDEISQEIAAFNAELSAH